MSLCTLLQLCFFPSLTEALTVSWGSKPARYFKRTPSTWFIIQGEGCQSMYMYICRRHNIIMAEVPVMYMYIQPSRHSEMGTMGGTLRQRTTGRTYSLQDS